MGVAMEKSGIDTSSFDKKYPNRRCYPGLKHSPNHILAAQELANWMKEKITIFGKHKIYKKVLFLLKTVGVQRITLTFGMENQ